MSADDDTTFNGAARDVARLWVDEDARPGGPSDLLADALDRLGAAATLAVPETVEPPATFHSELRVDPARALLAQLIAVVNRHQGRDAEQAMTEIEAVLMQSMDTPEPA